MAYTRRANKQPGLVRSLKFSYDKLSTCSRISGVIENLAPNQTLTFISLVGIQDLLRRPPDSQVVLDVPLPMLARHLPSRPLKIVMRLHGMQIKRTTTLENMIDMSDTHFCNAHCSALYSLFLRAQATVVSAARRLVMKLDPPLFVKDKEFDLQYATLERKYEMVKEWTSRISVASLREEPCGVCGRRMLSSKMRKYPYNSRHIQMLKSSDSTISRQIRVSLDDAISPLTEPILCPHGVCTDPEGNRFVSVCSECTESLQKNTIPELALVRGQWIGEIPEELTDLNLVEKMAIALCRHNNCVFQVKMGQRKMSGNAVIYSQPVQKFYNVLPPCRQELEECLVIVFIGKRHPTLQDYRRTPLLIRKNKVLQALNWLKLNHTGYADVTIEPKNLDSYPTDEPAVDIRYIPKEGNESPDNIAVYDPETERGTEDGMCSFSVHGLSGAELATMTKTERVLHALQHIDNQGQFISYGRSSDPQSIYHNSDLYPGLFPWLFPFGLGSLENGNLPPRMQVGRGRHIRRLLAYHDKRFQTDEYFLPIVFSQEQIRASVSGGHLVTNRKNVASIANNLMSVDLGALSDLIQRGKDKEPMKPTNQKEQECYNLLTPIRSVDGHVQGSLASKRYQRNELHSLIMQRGLPYFFITFSPVDYKSPICLYYCGMDEVNLDDPLLTVPTSMDRERLIAGNPVACSRFFHLIVTMFIEILLAPDHPKGGLFGPTDSYYGTVESQGRLTLHLHLLLWIKGSLSPIEMKNRLLADIDGYRQKMFEWLDNTIQAGYTSGSLASVRERVEQVRVTEPQTDYEKYLRHLVENPCCLLPRKPPPGLSGDALNKWGDESSFIADVVALFSNQHKHGMGCDWAKDGICRARFPRVIRTQHEIEDETGFLFMKQTEENINHYSPTMSLLLMCNHDVSPLRSGSQLKPIVAYVTDYITKTPLKTHAIFESIKSILSMRDELIQGATGMKEISRKLLTRIVNAITSRQEIGTPMIAHYMQGFPDHYTNEKFKVVYWRSYDNFVKSAWDLDDGVHATAEESVILDFRDDQVVPSSTRLDDYTLRPLELEDWTLYDFLKFTYVRAMSEDECERAATYLIQYESMSPPPRPPMLFDFNHSKVSTHVTQVQDRSAREFILTLIGGNLPRFTEGTEVTDDYARVMLMFFKAGGWRTGKELKDASVTWKDAFQTSIFSERSQSAMRHFNTFYECRDARFDFSIERQKNEKKASTGSVYIDRYIDEHDSLDTEQHEAMTSDQTTRMKDNLAALRKSEKLGRGMKRILAEMKEMDAFMDETVGVSSSMYSDLALADDTPFSEEIPRKSARQWRADLQFHKEKIRASKMSFIRDESPAEQTPSASRRELNREGDVVLIDPASVQKLCAEYSSKKFTHLTTTEISNAIISDFTLNEGQRLAFHLIVDHLSAVNPAPLRMYLGGVGGTGKSQVIKSTIAYLAARAQTYRFIVMAPTGSAAALVDGTTYHSALGFGNLKNVKTDVSAAKVKEELACVDLIFLDEISMVSCEDLCDISAKLGRAFPHTEPNLGGKSMIVAGDFGQLPPGSPFSHTLYSGSIDTTVTRGPKFKAVSGKSIWHTFTTVVILTENMRLTSMEPQDVAFSTALNNLRYKRCTPTDIALFRSRVIGIGVDKKIANSDRFRYVSILTGLNSHRDAINDSTSIMFATERKLPLLTFHSKDGWSSSPSTEFLDRTGMTPAQAKDHFQRYLWSLPPSITKNIPGKLTICRDMPVMLKYNEATELCATNGAEARILAWDEKLGPMGRRAAETIFVTLQNPPRNIKLPDLPLNVVPIPAASSVIKIKMADDTDCTISRTQLRLIPNFAMTDYMSQGRTRPNNVVDLSRCRGHQSMYTCLSRSTSLKGTLIIRDFNEKKMKGGLSGDLRREFAELEALDEYTKLRVTGKLPSDCPTSTREAVLVYFRKWRDAQASTGYVPPREPTLSDVPPIIAPPSTIFNHPMLEFVLVWNSSDWSCAYDTAIFMLWSVFMRPADHASLCNASVSKFVAELYQLFTKHTEGYNSHSALSSVRQHWRNELHASYPNRFPAQGRCTASLSHLLDITVSSREPYGHLKKMCRACGEEKTVNSYRSHIWPLHRTHSAFRDAPSATLDTDLALNSLFDSSPPVRCNSCNANDTSSLVPVFPSPPVFVILEIFADTITDRTVKINKSIPVRVNNSTYHYNLVVVGYHGSEHFVGKAVDSSSVAWWYDGMLNDGRPWRTEDNLSSFHNKIPHLLWYVLQS